MLHETGRAKGRTNLIQPEEIANVILFLVSPESSAITGTAQAFGGRAELMDSPGVGGLGGLEAERAAEPLGRPGQGGEAQGAVQGHGQEELGSSSGLPQAAGVQPVAQAAEMGEKERFPDLWRHERTACVGEIVAGRVTGIRPVRRTHVR